MADTDEKRKYDRIDSKFEVKINTVSDGPPVIRIQPDKNTGPKVGKSLNVSASGVLFKYHEKFELGSTVQVSFLQPNTFDIFKGNARIVRIELEPDNKEYEIGVEFIELNDDEKENLNYFLTR